MHPGYLSSIANMETSKCEDTEDESILEVSEFDWATYLGVIQYLRRQNIGLFWPPTYLNVDNVYPNGLSFYGSKMIWDGHQSFWAGSIRFGRVQITKISPEKSNLNLTKYDLNPSKTNWTWPKQFGPIEGQGINVDKHGYFLHHLPT